jgi:integrase
MNARGMGRVFRPKYPPTGQSLKQAREAGTLKESAIWWISYHRAGKDGGEIRESSRSTKRTDAIALLNARRGEIAQGEWLNPRADRTTLEDLLAMVKTDRRKNGRETDHLPAYERRLTEFFGASCRAANITADRIDTYTTKRQDDGAANATINRELASLRRGLRLAYRAGKVRRVPPVGLLRERNIRTGFFEPGEFRAVQAHLPAAFAPVAEFAYLTGWRKAEILGLTWPQVDFSAGLVRLEPGSTKNDDGRGFPFSALPALGALLTRRRDDTRAVERATGQVVRWVFHDRGRPIWAKRFYRAWWAATKAAGVYREWPHPETGKTCRGPIPHDFRRTAVRNLERAGVSRSVAMKLTGHKTESVYRRYAIVAETDQREGVAKLALLHAAQATAAAPVIPLARVAGDRRRPQVGKDSASSRRVAPPAETAGDG